jgi:hypothetical protein
MTRDKPLPARMNSDSFAGAGLRLNRKAWEEGRQAGLSGLTGDHDPYPCRSICSLSWTSGLIEGQAERSEPTGATVIELFPRAGKPKVNTAGGAVLSYPPVPIFGNAHYAPARDVTPGRGSSPSLLTARPRLSSAPLALGHPGRAEVKIYTNEKTVYCQ